MRDFLGSVVVAAAIVVAGLYAFPPFVYYWSKWAAWWGINIQ